MDFTVPYNLAIYFPLLFLVTIVYAILDCLWGGRTTKKDFISDTNIKETTTPDPPPQPLPSLPSSPPPLPLPLQDEPTINRIRRSNRIKKNRGVHKNRRQRF